MRSVFDMIAPSDLEEDFMFRTLLATGLLAATCLPAAAQEKLVWNAASMDNGATLSFSAPESDHGMIGFVCNKGNPTVLVGSYIGSKGLKADEPARIILSAGKVKKTFTGKAVTSEESAAVDVEAGATFDDVKAVLAGGKLMTIEVKGVKQQISLTGAPAAFASFETACKG